MDSPLLALSEAAGKLMGAAASLALGFCIDSPKLACACFITSVALTALAVKELL